MTNMIGQIRHHAWKDDGVYGYRDSIGRLLWEASLIEYSTMTPEDFQRKRNVSTTNSSSNHSSSNGAVHTR